MMGQHAICASRTDPLKWKNAGRFVSADKHLAALLDDPVISASVIPLAPHHSPL